MLNKLPLFIHAVVLGACLLLAGAVRATDVSGDVSGTWTLADSPYYLVANARVAKGQLLSVEAGVQVIATGAYHLHVEGKLIGNGTADQPITFTSQTQAAGAWEGIYFLNADEGSSLTYCNLLYGGDWNHDYIGSLDANASMFCYGTGAPELRNCRIAYGADEGLCYANGAVPNLSDCTFDQNGGIGLIGPMDAISALPGAVTLTNNGNGDRIGIATSTLSADAAWPAADYAVIGDLTIGAGATLGLAANSRLFFAADCHLRVEGVLTAVGSAGARIVFSSDTPSKGGWEGIYFINAATGSQLAYCDILYAGERYDNYYSYYDESSAILLYGTGAPTLEHCRIAHSAGYGIYMTAGAAATLTDCSLDNNTYSGLFSEASTDLITIAGCTVQGNSEHGLYIRGDNARVDGSTITGNGMNGVYFRGSVASFTGNTINTNTQLGAIVPSDQVATATQTNTITDAAGRLGIYASTLSGDALWPAGNYQVIGGLAVAAGATLTLAPGSSFYFGSNSHLRVEGGLSAVGTTAAHIVFSSDTPNKGAWEGIYFVNADAGSQLAYCDILYAGEQYSDYYSYYDGTGAVLLYGTGAPTFEHCRIAHSAGTGVYLAAGAAVTLTDCSLDNNTSSGLYSEAIADLVSVADCTVQDNGGHGLYIRGNNARVDGSTVSGNGLSGVYFRGSVASFTGNTIDTNTQLGAVVPIDQIAAAAQTNTISDAADRIGIYASTLSTDTVWPAGNYQVIGGLTVGAGANLTLGAGSSFYFGPNSHLRVEGGLSAVGTAGAHIVFSSDTPSKGAWEGIYFVNAAAGSQLAYCDILYAGEEYGDYYSYYDGNGAVLLHGTGAPTLEHCRIAHSAGYGVYTTAGAAPELTNCEIDNNTSGGVRSADSSDQLAITASSVHDNGGHGLYLAGNNNHLTNTTVATNTGTGVYVTGSIAAFSGNTIGTNTGIGVICPMDWVAAATLANTVSGNGAGNRIGIAASTLTTTAAWPAGVYEFLGSGMVGSGIALTLSAGSTLYFGSDDHLRVEGALIATGTDPAHITFTSANQSRGAWEGIYFVNADAGSALSYCDILYAGERYSDYHGYDDGVAAVFGHGSGAPTLAHCRIAYSGGSAVHITANAAPQITDSILEYNNGDGVYHAGGAATAITTSVISNNEGDGLNLREPVSTIAGNTVTSNGGYGLRCRLDAVGEALAAPADISGNTYTDIRVYGSTLTYAGEVTWPARTYICDSGNSVYSWTIAAGSTLRLAAGAIAYFDNGETIQVNGGLICAGSAQANVQLSGGPGYTAAGAWDGVRFIQPTGTCSFAHTQITHTGAGSDPARASVRIDGAGSVSFTDTLLADGAGYGIYCTDPTAAVTVANLTISNHNSYPFRVAAGDVQALLAQTFSGNALNHGEFLGAALTADATWHCNSLDRLILRGSADLQVAAGATLTLQPGTHLSIANDRGLQVAGTLNAVGTAGAHIVLTSAATWPDRGDWQGIRFASNAQGTLAYCDLTYAGAGVSGDPAAAVLCQASAPTITHSQIAESGGFGLYCDGSATPTVTDTEITGCNDYALVANVNVFQTYFDSNNIHTNTYNAVGISGGSLAQSSNWTNLSFTRVLMAEITVPIDITLGWGAGVVVKARGNGGIHVAGGTLQISGTSGNPAVLTSYQDDTAGDDCGGGGPYRGDWQSIRFSGGDSGNNDFTQARLAYGGGSGGYLLNGAGITAPAAGLHVTHSASGGAYLSAGITPLDLTAAVFSNNSGTGAVISGDALLTSCHAEANGGGGISVTGTATVLQGRYHNNGAAGLAAAQASAGSTEFTSNAGDGISVSGSLQLSNATLNNNGGNGADAGAGLTATATTFNNNGNNGIDANGAVSLTLGCQLHDNGTHGLRVVGAGMLQISTATVTGNGDTGIWCGPAVQVDAQNNTISDNAGCLFAAAITTVETVLTSNSFGEAAAANLYNAYEITGGLVDQDFSLARSDFQANDFAYLVSGTVTIAATAGLTIEPGLILKLNGGGFIVHGELVAMATAAQPLILTSYRDNSLGVNLAELHAPVRGDWNGFTFTSTSVAILEHCRLRYAGGGGQLFDFNNADSLIRLCSFEHLSGDLALCRNQASPSLLGNVLYQASGTAVRCTSLATPVVIANTFRDFDGDGLFVDQAAPTFSNNLVDGRGAVSHAVRTTVDTAPFVFAHNLFWDFAAEYSDDNGQTSRSLAGVGTANLYADPHFTSPAREAQLLNDSPALGAGLADANIGAPPVAGVAAAYQLEIVSPTADTAYGHGDSPLLQVTVSDADGHLAAGLQITAYILYSNGADTAVAAFTANEVGSYSSTSASLAHAGPATIIVFAADPAGPTAATAVNSVDISIGTRVGIVGTVAYSGGQAGAVVVQAATSPDFATDLVAATTLSQPGTYCLAGLIAGTYHLRAFRDSNANGLLDTTEAHSLYSANPVTVNSGDLTDIDLTLIDPDTDTDTLPDWWEQLYFGNLDATADGDADGDGETNQAEYTNATSPIDACSTTDPANAWQQFAFSIFQQYQQQTDGSLGTASWGAELRLIAPTGSVITAAALQKPPATAGTKLPSLTLIAAGAQAVYRLDYTEFDDLAADMVAGTYAVTLNVQPLSGAAQTVRFRFTVDSYASNQFPAAVRWQNPAPGATVSTVPLLTFDSALWSSLQVTPTIGDVPAYLHTRADTEADHHQVPAGTPLPSSGACTATVSRNAAASAPAWLTTRTAISIQPEMQPGLLLSNADILTVIEGGTSVIYGVRLTKQPASQVTITVVADAQVTTTTANALNTLVFTPDNWNQAQSVTVSAIDDDKGEGPHIGTIQHSGSGDNYDLLTLPDVSVAIADDCVTVHIDVIGHGTVSPRGTRLVDLDAIPIALMALADPGYQFIGWSGDTNGVADTAASQTTLAPTAATTLYAQFAPRQLYVSGAAPGLAADLGTTAAVVATAIEVKENTSLDFSVAAAAGSGAYTYAWTVDDNATAETAAAFTYSPDYSLVVHPDDSTATSIVCTITDSTTGDTATATWTTIQITDHNRAPVVTDLTAAITSAAGGTLTTQQNLLCTLSAAATDPDAEDVAGLRYHYVWTLADGTPLRDIVALTTTDTLPASATVVGAVITCTVTALDCYDAGSAAVIAPAVTIIAGAGNWWNLALECTGAQVETLALGMQDGATDSYDPRLDQQTAPPAQDRGYAVFSAASRQLIRDFRPDTDAARWQLAVSADPAQAVNLTWNPADVPAAGLFLMECDAQWQPQAAGLLLDLADTSSLNVAAGTTGRFAIYFGIQPFALTLQPGWNLISLPFTPEVTSVGAVFGNSIDGIGWQWQNGCYQIVTDLEAGRGYWFFRISSEPSTLNISPAVDSVHSGEIDLAADWNLIGPIAEAPYPALPLPLATTTGAAINTVLWGWDGVQYETIAHNLACGNGYWLRLDTPCTAALKSD